MNFVGAIVPEVCQHCACGWGGFFAVIQNLLKLGIVLAIFFAVLMFAYAGFLWVTNPASPSNKEKGREVLMQTIIGLVVVLGAWLIVNTVLVALSTGGVTSWTSIFSTAQPTCLSFSPPPTPSNDGGLTATNPSNPSNSGGSNQGGTGANCPVPDESTMVALPAADVVGGTGLATPTTVQNYIAMRAAALKDGIDLKVTSAYRSDATQVALWNKNPDPSVVAKPCSLGGNGSNHNSGQALDLTVGCSTGSTCSSAAYKWLKANGGNWGFYNNLPTDPVHWSPTGR